MKICEDDEILKTLRGAVGEILYDVMDLLTTQIPSIIDDHKCVDNSKYSNLLWRIETLKKIHYNNTELVIGKKKGYEMKYKSLPIDIEVTGYNIERFNNYNELLPNNPSIVVIDDIVDYCIAIVHYGVKNVTFITIDEEIEMVVDEIHDDTIVKRIPLNKNFLPNLKHELRNMKKIDAIIGNPPYKGQLHLNILETCYEHSDFVSLVHPGAWVYAQKEIGRTRKKANDLKSLFGKHIVSFEFIDGNTIFNINQFQPCVITTINKNKEYDKVHIIDNNYNKDYQIDSAFDVNPFLSEDVEKFNSVKRKIWNYCKERGSINAIVSNNNENDDFFLTIPNISGHVAKKGEGKYYNKDFFQLVYEQSNKIFLKDEAPENSQLLSFDNYDEADNTLKYLKQSKLAKFSLMIVKISQNLHRGELKYVPMFDFTTPKTDDELYEILNLTEEEIKFIEDNVDCWLK